MTLTKIQKQILLEKHNRFMEEEKRKLRTSDKKTEKQKFFQELKDKHPDIAFAISEDYSFRKKLPKRSRLKVW